MLAAIDNQLSSRDLSFIEGKIKLFSSQREPFTANDISALYDSEEIREGVEIFFSFFRTDEKGVCRNKPIPYSIAEYLLDSSMQDRTGFSCFVCNGTLYAGYDGEAEPYKKKGSLLSVLIENLIEPSRRSAYFVNNVIGLLKENAPVKAPEEVPGITAEPGTEQAAAEYIQPETLDSIFNNTDIQPPPFIVDGLITTGLTILGAPPKSYKSWLALDLCLSISSGEDFLGFKTAQGRVLYYDFENSYNTIKNRLMCKAGMKSSFVNVLYRTEEDVVRASGRDSRPRVGDGLEALLEREIANTEDLKLIILDTYAFITAPRGRNETPYDADYKTASALNSLARKHNIAILAITHTTQMKHPEDVFSEITGTNGVVGGTASNMVIAKEKRTSKEGVLSATGKDIAPQALRVEFDDKNLTWICHGPVDLNELTEEQELLREYESSRIRAGVLAIADEISEPWTGSASQIVTRANNLNVPVTESNRTVGLFLSKHQGRFKEKDNVSIYAGPKHGNAGKSWTICPTWKQLDNMGAAAEPVTEKEKQEAPFT